MKQRERWVKWCIDLVEPVGYCWQDLGKLHLLDNDEETILSALKWSFECKRYKEALQIARGFEYYYFVRGIWRDKLEVDLIRAEAARSYGSIEEEVIARSSFVRVLSLDRKTEEAAAQLPRLNELIEHEVSGDALYVYWNALATYYQATNQEDKEEQFLQKAMEFSGESTIPRQINACASLADYRYRKGALSEAKRLFHTALRTAVDHNYERIIAVCGLRLAEINLAQQNLEVAEEGLATSLERANTYNDLRCIAEVQLAWAQLYTLHDDYLSAHNALQEAVDRFERLGMRYALAETQARLSEVHARLYEAAD
jgi:tetratricopeptide (TPR) repeat protein